MNKDNIIRMICTFLKKNDALEKYCINALSYDKKNCHSKISLPKNVRLLEKVRLTIRYKLGRFYAERQRYILRDSNALEDFFIVFASSFDWWETPEGDDYWRKIDKKWRSFFNHNRNKFRI